ncbi:hypothetical protein Tco_1177727 [Tanacetum coccineum]
MKNALVVASSSQSESNASTWSALKFDVLLVLDGNLELIDVLGNIIALLRLAIGSPVGRNDGTTNLELGYVDSTDMDGI